MPISSWCVLSYKNKWFDCSFALFSGSSAWAVEWRKFRYITPLKEKKKKKSTRHTQKKWDWLERIEKGMNEIDKIKANEMNQSQKQNDNQKAIFFSNVH